MRKLLAYFALSLAVFLTLTFTAHGIFTDSSIQGPYRVKTKTVALAASPTCTSGVFELMNMRWQHASADNVRYRVIVTRLTTNELVKTYDWLASPPALNTEMKQEIRATGTGAITTNGSYWAEIEASVGTAANSWTSKTTRIAFRRTAGLMYCGH